MAKRRQKFEFVTWEVSIYGGKVRWRRRKVRVRAPSDAVARVVVGDYFTEYPELGIDGYVIEAVRQVRGGACVDAIRGCVRCGAVGAESHDKACRHKRKGWVALERSR